MTDPAPTRADVTQAREVEREVAEQTYRVAADRLPRQVRGVARAEAARVARRIGAIGAVLAVLASVAIAVAAYSTATNARDVATANAETIELALGRLDRANDTLTARGQTPVPQPGPPPTQAQIDAAVARAIAANPPRDGVDGQSPPCLSTPDMCEGADGEDGADGEPGRSVTAGPQPVRLDDGTCVWRVEYSAAPLVEEFPAGDASCPGGAVIGLGARR